MLNKDLNSIVANYVRRYQNDLPTLTAMLSDVAGEAFSVSNPVTIHSLLEATGYCLSASRLGESPEEWAKKIVAASEKKVTTYKGVRHRAPTVTETPEKSTPKTTASITTGSKKERPYLKLATMCIEAGTFTKKELKAKLTAEFATLNASTLGTFVTDLTNEKYSAYKRQRNVMEDANKKLHFA